MSITTSQICKGSSALVELTFHLNQHNQQETMLIIVSGPDRVGKSTLISEISEALEQDCFIAHHGPPPQAQESIFDFYREDIRQWKLSKKTYAIFDRAYPCSYILEQHRRRNAGHFEDVIDFEIELADATDGAVTHLGIFRPWHWSAPLHIEELRDQFPKAAPWYIRDEYVARMQEHQVYTEQLLNFYENITMFPNVQLHNENIPGRTAVSRCIHALEES